VPRRPGGPASPRPSKGHFLIPPKTGKWIAHPADRWNAARALAAAPILFAPFVTNFFAGYEILYGVAAFMLIGDTNYLLHLHIHRPLSRKPALNLLFDLGMGTVTGMSSSNWRIQHLYGHHRGIDLPYRCCRGIFEDYSALRAVFFSAMSMWETFYAPIVNPFGEESSIMSIRRSVTVGRFASRPCCCCLLQP
jgi:hypothetical protein